MGYVSHVLENKSILRFAYLFVEKNVDTIYIKLVNVYHMLYYFDASWTRLRYISSMG